MIEKGEELWLMLIIHIISKSNDMVNIILLCALHVRVSVLINMIISVLISNFSNYLLFYFIYLFIYLFNHLFIRVSKYSKASFKIKKLVNNKRN